MSRITAKKIIKICFISVSLCLCGLFFSACSQLETPKSEPFYAETAPPQKKEFRWSNGKMPKSFDPALAAAAPETDIVRAVYEGLTDTDAKTLKPVAAIAVEWNASEDFKTWTFTLRKDARWSNGERITAKDFVRSWKRLAEMGEKIPRRELLQNIVGLNAAANENSLPVEEESGVFANQTPGQEEPSAIYKSNTNASVPPSPPTPKLPEANTAVGQKPNVEKLIEAKFGVEAIDTFTLKIALLKPDKDFPALVAHPIFRPVYGDGKDLETGKLTPDIVTSGAFHLAGVGQDGITLERSEKYWNREAVELERVRFVPTENAEKALEAYRAGEVDAVTNADFEPLALKLLSTYDDFKLTTHAALNFYEFNNKKPPFDDRRVREALTIAIERERIAEDEMDGASVPAFSFLPFEINDETKIVQDAQKAKTLLAESGFPGGENFPTVKLLVNRNNVQQRIARSVAKMWKRNLNVETEIVAKDSSDLTAARAASDFDLVRRGAVLATNDETANMLTIFPVRADSPNQSNGNPQQSADAAQSSGNPNGAASVFIPEKPQAENESAAITGENPVSSAPEEDEAILTEEKAFGELTVMPLYFPISYSLVKPYIQGFDVNILDAPSLKNVRIDNSWQPKTVKKEY